MTNLTVHVPKGTKVNVKEVENISGGDSRIPHDRHVLISGSEQLKVAVKRAAEPGASKASVVLMCG